MKRVMIGLSVALVLVLGTTATMAGSEPNTTDDPSDHVGVTVFDMFEISPEQYARMFGASE